MRRVLPNTRNIVNVASAPVEFTLQAHRGADEEDYDEEVDKGPNVKNAYIWRTDEIVKYLQSQTWSHPNLISAVKQHRIDGMGFLRLEKVDLEEFGIEQSIDRNRILINIYKIAPDTIRVKPVLSRVERDELKEEMPDVRQWVEPKPRTPRSKYADKDPNEDDPDDDDPDRERQRNMMLTGREVAPSAPPRKLNKASNKPSFFAAKKALEREVQAQAKGPVGRPTAMTASQEF